jgi:hypothetical protein
MSTNSVFDWSDVAGSNTDVAGNGIAGSSNISLGNDVFQNIMAQIAAGLIERGSDIATASTISFTGATTRALTHDLTGTTTVTAVTLTAGHWRICRAQGAFQLTASSTLVVNGSTSTNYTTTAGDLLIFFGYSASTVRVWTFTGGSATFATLAQALGGTSSSVTLAPNALAQERGLGVQPVNLGIAASVGSSALTVSLKGIDGNDPSATNPVTIPFRNVTAATGTPSYLTITAATSIVISSGSTMGFTSGVAGRLWIVGFNDGGTFRLGLVNVLNGTSIMALRDGIYSSTAEGGAGAADSAQVIYTGTAVTSKAMTVLAYLEATEATAGTWATAPSLIKLWQPGDPLPGDMVQVKENFSGASTTGTTLIPLDNTIPQITEGDQYFSQSITPSSSANVLTIEHVGGYNSTAQNNVTVAFFQDTTANALAVSGPALISVAANAINMYLKYSMIAGTNLSTTFKLRAGQQNAGTLRLNGYSGAAIYGGVEASFLSVREFMA